MPEVNGNKREKTGVDALIAEVHAAVAGDTGMSAVLRRLDPEDEIGVPALHAVLVRAGVTARDLEGQGRARYATCVRLVALLQRVEGESVSPGKGFAEMELSEQRLARLQASSDQGLRDLVTSIVRRAVSARVRLAPRDLCLLVLGEGPSTVAQEQGAQASQRILRDFYKAKDAAAAAAA